MERLSGLAVRYSVAPQSHPLTGRRAANLELSDRDRLFPLLVDGHYALIDFGRCDHPVLDDVEFGDAVRHITRCRVAPGARPQPGEWREVSVALIRPDDYIGWASTEFDASASSGEIGRAVRGHTPRVIGPLETHARARPLGGRISGCARRLAHVLANRSAGLEDDVGGNDAILTVNQAEGVARSSDAIGGPSAESSSCCEIGCRTPRNDRGCAAVLPSLSLVAVDRRQQVRLERLTGVAVVAHADDGGERVGAGAFVQSG